MNEWMQSAVLIGTLLLLLAGGLWVALALIACGVVSLVMFTEVPADLVFATKAWDSAANWSLVALPMFIWMGEILFRTRLSQDMFSGLAPLMRRLPGRLVHVNVLGCGIFAAVSGSSAATAATIGKISLPELKARGYDEGLSVGSLAGAGTLGLLIPPSIVMIVYGVAAQTSIVKLFVAGILPGILLMFMFSSYIALWSWRHPDKVPPADAPLPWRVIFSRLKLLLPVMLLIMAVIGSIYTGVATATESAAVGVLGSLGIALWSRSLDRASFVASLMGAVKTSCMISFIILGAGYLTAAMSFTGLPGNLAAWISSMGLSQYELIFVLTLFFIVLGAFLDGISIVVLTTAVLMPAIQQAQIDPIWFGIYLILVVEMAQITPPVGFNLFVIQNITRHNLWYLIKKSFPFFLILVAATGVVTVFPDIVMVLPDAMARP
ncbi:tripartite ATP-independent transporter DctM subunit [Comamonas sp. BIGb0124]|uniref:TRAP transporter large permease n=1 Tax=Comamonas sp. BIGb0124 TaxID=2485130 RepID=UPI000F482E24|nr:TRAP transporter large permease subunit [Comamonas sp. BIGb0124]ROR18643.1 tripartite ATP-independent transporter DctM subunit [Comamonas sp. BIGb0124]